MTAFPQLTADHCLEIFSDWARYYPSARFVVVALAPDGTDGAVLGWGVALPDLAFAYLPEIRFTGRARTAGDLVKFLRPSLDVHVVWVDPEPEHWSHEMEA
jgi:hypothetical protein